MTVNPTQTTCPACSSIYVTVLESGTFFCAECRHEWDQTAKVEPVPATIDDAAQARLATGETWTGDLRDKFSTMVEVEHDDGGSGNWRTDRYTYVTDEPHTVARAEIEATDHFLHEVGSGVRDVKAVFRFPDVDPPAGDQLADDTAAELEGLIAQTDADAEAYLASLIGAGVTLEGGQRATILEFGDDDQILVQLQTGDTATVEFNDVISADMQPGDLEIVVDEIDDETAEAFGTGSLLFACMVIEAGVASIEGEGAEAHLVESPTGWFIVDEDAVPLMELASAAAVAMLILSFGIPKADIAEWIAKIRSDALAARPTEVQGHDEHPDDNENGSDTGAAD